MVTFSYERNFSSGTFKAACKKSFVFVFQAMYERWFSWFEHCNNPSKPSTAAGHKVFWQVRLVFVSCFQNNKIAQGGLLRFFNVNKSKNKCMMFIDDMISCLKTHTDFKNPIFRFISINWYLKWLKSIQSFLHII